jgi:hypothetical protein
MISKGWTLGPFQLKFFNFSTVCFYTVEHEYSLSEDRHTFNNAGTGTETISMLVRFRGPADGHIILSTHQRADRNQKDKDPVYIVMLSYYLDITH